jgi:transcriptional regulator with XRE-family HTH domain
MTTMTTKKQERNEEIRRLRLEEKLRLEEIAARFGITKQRVAVIVGRTRQYKRDTELLPDVD